MAVRTVNEHGKTVYLDVVETDRFNDFEFYDVDMSYSDTGDRQMALHTNLGSITILDRMTGFGWRDTETGFRDKNGKFWLASGMFDVRDAKPKTIGDAIHAIKMNSNNCKGED